jgi:hypothetical protein
MKKCLAAILAVLYLSTSLGATVHWHYCMGRLVGWGLVDREAKECMSCGMPVQQAFDEGVVTTKSCCQDVHKQIKNEKDQKPGQSSPELAKLTPVAVLLSHRIWQAPFINTLKVGHPAINGPPRVDEVPVFLRNSNFRI